MGDGSTEGTATSFENAIKSVNVIAGDTIMMLDGTYTGYFQTTINGELGNYVIIRPKNCYQAIIDGGLLVDGEYTIVRNIEITNSNPNRGEWTDPNGSNPRPPSLFLNHAENSLAINNLIHDGGVGIPMYQSSNNSVVYGNLIWNSGNADEGGYAQNIYYHGVNQIVKHNIFAGAFKRTFAAWGTNDYVVNTQILQNVIFERAGMLLTHIPDYGIPSSSSIVSENHILNNGFNFGGSDEPLLVEKNRVYAPACYMISYNKTAEMRENIFVGTGGGTGLESYEIANPVPGGYNYNFHDNQYFWDVHTGYSKPFQIEAVAWYSWAEWQALGFDLTSSFTNALPNANEVFVYPNEYLDANDCRMGIVVIWNWEGSNNVIVDLTTLGLQLGTTYRWRQAQDPLVDVDTWECAGNSYTFAMTGHTVAKPIGFDEELIATQFPTFGCFIIEKVV